MAKYVDLFIIPLSDSILLYTVVGIVIQIDFIICYVYIRTHTIYTFLYSYTGISGYTGRNGEIRYHNIVYYKMTSDQMKKLVLDRSNEIFELLTYLKDHQDEKPAISKQNLVRYMYDKGLSSRVTSLNLINYLLQEGILIDDKVMNYQSRLSINPDYNFDNLLDDLLKSQIQEIYKKLEPLQQFGSNKKTFTAKDIIKAWQTVYPTEKKVKSVQIS